MAVSWTDWMVSLPPLAWQHWSDLPAGAPRRPRGVSYCGDLYFGDAMSVVPLSHAVLAPRARERVVTLLGATGSIGASTVDLLRLHRERFRVEAVTAQRNAASLAKLAR